MKRILWMTLVLAWTAAVLVGAAGCDRSELDQLAYCEEPCRCPPTQLTVYCYDPGDALCECDCTGWIVDNCPNVLWRGDPTGLDGGLVGDGGLEDGSVDSGAVDAGQ